MGVPGVGMVEGNASMYLASPRIAEKVTGERTTLEEMGGATMHATVSGCGDEVFGEDWEAIAAARLLLSYLPDDWRAAPAPTEPVEPLRTDWDGAIPTDPNVSYDVRDVFDRFVDGGTFFEIKAGWAQEMVVGLARLRGRVVGLVANQPMVRSGAIFVDSADKAARFITMCDAFNIPLVFLHDVPGFMVGVAVERQGIIRHGAKMVTDGRRRGADHQRGAAQVLRRGLLRDVRARLRTPGHARAPHRHHRHDGRRGLGQRHVRLEGRGHRRRGGAGRVRRRPRGRAAGRREPAAHGRRPRRRRPRRTGGPAQRVARRFADADRWTRSEKRRHHPNSPV